jgi:hypothetical protein
MDGKKSIGFHRHDDEDRFLNLSDAAYIASTWIMPTLIAITRHEAAHAFVAWKLGDDTAHRLGLPAIRSPTTFPDHSAGIVERGCGDPAQTDRGTEPSCLFQDVPPLRLGRSV